MDYNLQGQVYWSHHWSSIITQPSQKIWSNFQKKCFGFKSHAYSKAGGGGCGTGHQQRKERKKICRICCNIKHSEEAVNSRKNHRDYHILNTQKHLKFWLCSTVLNSIPYFLNVTVHLACQLVLRTKSLPCNCDKQSLLKVRSLSKQKH